MALLRACVSKPAFFCFYFISRRKISRRIVDSAALSPKVIYVYIYIYVYV
jgi:hypothetical protein